VGNITLTIPDAIMPDVIDALADRGGYDTLMVPEGQTKPTKQKFAKDQIIDYVKTVTRHYKAGQQEKIARDDAYADIDSKLDIT
jgi:hypothetical protein